MITGGSGVTASTGVVANGPVWLGSSSTGATEQAVRLPTIAANSQRGPARRTLRNGNLIMALILLEALLALVLFVVIVWWTMFSGRNKGELPSTDKKDEDDPKP
jgi:cbb3-type cytochrome oxidase subunit 3